MSVWAWVIGSIAGGQPIDLRMVAEGVGCQHAHDFLPIHKWALDVTTLGLAAALQLQQRCPCDKIGVMRASGQVLSKIVKKVGAAAAFGF